ncbi:N-acetyltransferase [Crenobacter sp. SG2305]|uniref:GNAT family N-acetyltransferase n=1 Tax=Crenobacter oryzisoli TaxID=3056844 RepID=UPI0025AA827A|nr:N-acetyltransferase [Crenobacter sp. SG2305]MDN0081720.1 N-acetyltransferase [Crenobacter sp. SG2305]
MIRTPTIAELPQVFAIEQDVFQYVVYPPFLFRQALDLWGEWLLIDDDCANGFAGYALGAPSLDDHEAWLLSLAVRASHRGRGVGEQLTRALLDSLRRRGFRSALLTVDPANAGAVRLYQRLGFAIEREEAEYFGPGEPRLVMRAQLG